MSLSEAARDAGYLWQVSCRAGGGDGDEITVGLGSEGVRLELAAGDDVVCSFDLTLGAIVSVELEVEPASPQAFTFQGPEGEFALDSAIVVRVSAEEDHLRIDLTGQAGGKVRPVRRNQFESTDRQVVITISDDRETLTISQHGIDRIARKSA